jgi:hypothetical protein
VQFLPRKNCHRMRKAFPCMFKSCTPPPLIQGALFSTYIDSLCRFIRYRWHWIPFKMYKANPPPCGLQAEGQEARRPGDYHLTPLPHPQNLKCSPAATSPLHKYTVNHGSSFPLLWTHHLYIYRDLGSFFPAAREPLVLHMYAGDTCSSFLAL